MNLFEVFGIPSIAERNYWLVRTTGGNHYDDFTLHNYIAIAWDYVTLDLLATSSETSIKRLIENNESTTTSDINVEDDDIDDDMAISDRSKAIVTGIYNKIIHFVKNFNIGDVVIVPSKSNKRISIGIIESDAYEDPDYVGKTLKEDPDAQIKLCPFYKRRRVRWVKRTDKQKVDVYLLKAFSSHHAISSINEYADYINREIYQIYSSKNQLHSVIRTRRQSGMTFRELREMADSLDDLITFISEDCDNQFDPRDLQVKVNIHSPGLIELIGITAAVGIPLSMLVFSLNHFLNGGRTLIKFKNKETEFTLGSESKGYLDKRLEKEKFELEKMERLVEISKKLDLQIPSLDYSQVQISESGEISIAAEDDENSEAKMK